MVKEGKMKKPSPKLKEAAKNFVKTGEAKGTYKGPLVQRTNYDKGIEMKKTVRKKADRPFGSDIKKGA